MLNKITIAGLLIVVAVASAGAGIERNELLHTRASLDVLSKRYATDAKDWKDWNGALYKQRQQAEAQHSPNYQHVVLPFGSPARLEIPKDCQIANREKWQNIIEFSCPDGTDIKVQAFPKQ